MAIRGTPSKPSAASTVSHASFGILGPTPLSTARLRVCARSEMVVNAEAISAAARPPVNSPSTLPASEIGVSAASPSAVTPPGTSAR